jgi:hypothetical protein
VEIRWILKSGGLQGMKLNIQQHMCHLWTLLQFYLDYCQEHKKEGGGLMKTLLGCGGNSVWNWESNKFIPVSKYNLSSFWKDHVSTREITVLNYYSQCTEKKIHVRCNHQKVDNHCTKAHMCL